jgi:hypothetical protein
LNDNSVETERYWDTNLVHTLVIYEWARSFAIPRAKDLFDRFAARVGRTPDHVGVASDIKSYDYKYKGFLRRDVINRAEWCDLNYLWLRYPNVLSDFSIECNVSIPEFRHMSFHVDEAAVGDAAAVIEDTIADLAKEIGPLYGYAETRQYGYGPRQYVRGVGGGTFEFLQSKEADIDPHEDKRGGEFGRVFRAKERGLDRRFRDIYRVNLISGGHLSLLVEGLSLADWIANGNRGVLTQLGDITWKWSLKPLEQMRVRKTILEAGHLVVSV